jgi:hypothetical protein
MAYNEVFKPFFDSISRFYPYFYPQGLRLLLPHMFYCTCSTIAYDIKANSGANAYSTTGSHQVPISQTRPRRSEIASAALSG